MKRICVFNIKGGVGKTTTSVNLAAGLARAGKKVLLMDLDPQGGVSACLDAKEGVKNMYHLIANGADLKECLTRMGKNLDCVTSNEQLNEVDIALAERANRDFILSLKLENVKDYDFIVMDCPPHMGTMARNALFFADEVFIPASTDILGYQGLKKTFELVQKLGAEAEEEIRIGKVVPTLYDRRLRVSKSILGKMQNEFYGLTSDPIRVNSKLKESPKVKKSIFSYAKASTGAKDYRRLAEDLLHAEGQSPSAFAESEAAALEIMDS